MLSTLFRSRKAGRPSPTIWRWRAPGAISTNPIESRSLIPKLVRRFALFHPRKDAWNDHFYGDEYEVVGLTTVGRATIVALDMNHARRFRIRQAEQLFGLFPPSI